ncbi:MAG: ABC transporter permease subunit [Vicinamibacterales bacterium]
MREKVKDYVGAAMVAGVSDTRIIFSHILPNALTPVVSFAPFVVVANIGSLVALDFLGFGLPAPTPTGAS